MSHRQTAREAAQQTTSIPAMELFGDGDIIDACKYQAGTHLHGASVQCQKSIWLKSIFFRKSVGKKSNARSLIYKFLR